MSGDSATVAAVSRNDAYTFTKPNRDEIVLVEGWGVEGDIHAGVNVRHRSRVAADPSQPNLRQVHLIQAELFDEVAGKGFDVPAGGIGENVTTRGIDLLALPRGTILRFGPAPAGAPAPGSGREDGGAAPAVAYGGAAGGGAATGGGAAGGGTATGGGAAGGGTATGGGAAGGGAAGGGAAGEGGGVGSGGPVAAVLAAAEAATLDEATARAVEAVAAALRRDREHDGADPRAAIVVAGLRNPCAQIDRFRSGLLKQVLGRDDAGNVVRRAGVMAVVLRGGVIRPGDPVVAEPPPGVTGPLERV
ncbi:Transcription elongation factor SPT5 [Actinoplanes sp. SE50/110]|uniref:MOSC domain-containing protein n=1 Tax=unclassified Actinoplanes TaxID=2626549 RepID=UPI0003115E9D|nr:MULTISPECIES: hypothetical protein [unclassified Actinoplanes]AEV82294.2 Transcription elongation factor SPT5 [Actinoplanes sp. SE50/110]